MDSDPVGRDAARLDLHNVASNHARGASPTHQSVDRHARFAPLERTHARPETGLVRHRRVSQLAATAAASYCHHGESQIAKPGHSRLSGPEPDGGPLWG